MEAFERRMGYFQDHTKELFEYIEKVAIQTGDKCDSYMEKASPRRSYLCEVLLRIPLFFIIHQWFLLSPNSSYWIIDVLLFILRYGGALVLAGTWACNIGVLLQSYTILTVDIAVMWLKRMDYWTNQDETYGICHEKNILVWSDITEHLVVPAVCSILLQAVYLCYRPGAFLNRAKEHTSAWAYIALLSTLVPSILSVLGIFPSFMSGLAYWIDSILFVSICVLEVVSNMDVDSDVDKKKLKMLILQSTMATDEQTRLKYKTKINELQQRITKRLEGGNFASRFPGKWFMRDTMLAFGALHLFSALLIEIIIHQRVITSVPSFDTLLEVSTMWCTTHVVVIFISYGLGLMSNICVALCHLFLTAELNIIEAFDANIGGVVQVSALITFTEANILSLEYIEKLEAMKMVAFLSVYAIIFQTLDVLERKILHAVNSGVSPGVLFYIRIGILTGLLVTAPSLSTVIVSRHLNISPWLLFFASGNCTLILRTVFLLLECSLVSFTWHTTQHLGTLEDLIHYTRVLKSFCLVVLNTAQCYFRYICPFFKGWWFFRLCLAIFSFVVVVCGLGLVEVNRYKVRNRMKWLLNNLPDVKFEPDMRADDEECAICYSVMAEGKMLPCKHVFHKDCLRRWFQVKAVCPFCNTELKEDASKSS